VRSAWTRAALAVLTALATLASLVLAGSANWPRP